MAKTRTSVAPTILYKYFTPDRLDVLRDGMIRFTQPVVFNDPLDCRPRLLTPRELPHISSGEQCCTDWYVRLIQETWASVDRASVGLLCLSETPANLLMWAHYAQDHKGFVVGFDARHAFFSKSADGTGLWKVRYSRKRGHMPKDVLRRQMERQPRPTPGIQAFIVEEDELSNPDTNPHDYRFVKSLEWAYEREWRLIRAIAPPYYAIQPAASVPIYLFPFPRSIVRLVIIGCRGFTALYPALREILAQEPGYSRVSLHKMRTHESEFRVQSYIASDRVVPWDEEPLGKILMRTPISARSPVTDTMERGTRPQPIEDADQENSAVPSGDLSTEARVTPAIEAIREPLDGRRSPHATEPPYSDLLSAVREALDRRGSARNDTPRRQTERLPTTKTADECFELSLKLFLQDNSSEAVAALQRGIELSDSEAEGFYSAGLVLQTLGLDEGAQHFFAKAIQRNPTSAQAHWSLGNSYQALGQTWPAEATFRTALKCEPKHSRARTNLGTVFMLTERLAEAEACFRRAIKDDPQRWEAYYNLAGLLVRTEQYEEAAEHLVNLAGELSEVERLPFLPALCHHIASVLQALDADLERKERIISLLVNRLQEPAVINMVVLACRQRGVDGSVLPLLQKTVREQPANVDSWILLAAVQMKLGEVATSRQCVASARACVLPSDLMKHACLAAISGDEIAALKYLQDAQARGQFDNTWFADPIFDGVRDDPGFQKVDAGTSTEV